VGSAGDGTGKLSGHRRFFVDQIDGSSALITGAKARQVIRVLRLRPGDEIVLLDGSGIEHLAVIREICENQVRSEITASRIGALDPRINASLAIATPKGDRLELVIQKATELGISELVLMECARNVVRFETGLAASRMERLRRIAEEAAEQCGRTKAPEIVGILDFADAVRRSGRRGQALLAWEGDGAESLRSVLREGRGLESVAMLVGPEGGFTEAEVEYARDSGAVCVSLGKRVLRCETAAICMAAVAMYELEW